MSSTKELTVGIIGLGSFGTFTAQKLPSKATVLGFDEDDQTRESSVIRVDLKTLIQKSNIIVLAIPLSSYKHILPIIQKYLKPHQLLVDVCSVKVLPDRMICALFPDHPNILISHPLFGSRSFNRMDNKNQLIVTKSAGALADKVLLYCQNNLNIEIVHMSADEHDLLMADIHAITFFVAKALQNLKLKDHEITTPSYKMITDLVNFSKTHTESLLQTIENGNPYAKDVRDRLVQEFEDLNLTFTNSKTDWIK